MPQSPEVCPHCGAEVPQGATVCPECGSDASTGWSEQARYDGLGLPDNEFNYDEFARHEFGDGNTSVRPGGVSWFWWLVALLVLAGFLALFVG